MTDDTPNPLGRNWGGPYVTLAAICEKVLIEQDGVISVIRMVDRFTIPRFTPPEIAPPLQPIIVTLAVVLKANEAQGTATVRIHGRTPSERTFLEVEQQVLFEREERGVYLPIQMAVPTEEQGVYWFDIVVDGQFMTSVPMRVMIQTVTLPRPANPQ